MTRRRAATVTVPVTVDGLLILDVQERTYGGPSRSGKGWHLIQPARADHRLVRDGAIPVGALACTCEGGSFNGQCWRLEQARAYEEREWTALFHPMAVQA